MLHHRPTPTSGAWFLAFLLFATALFSFHAANAQTADPFTVRNVQVDVSAENVNIARDRALAEGQRQAYESLMQRLTAQADWARLPKVSDNDVENLVLDVGIDQEKRSAVRYLATLSVRFKPDSVRRMLRNANIAYAEWRGRPVVVLPVYQPESGPVLSETPNAWRDAWRSGAAQGVVPLIVPTPDQTEGTVTAAQAATGGPEVLAAVGQRFNTPEVLIAAAAPVKLENGKYRLDVVLSGTGPVSGGLSGTRSYGGETGDALDPLLRHAVEDIAKTANDNYKSGNLLQFDRSASIAVMVPLSSFDDWLQVRDKLNRTTPVRAYEVAALSKSEAALVLHFVGDQQQLESLFMQNGLVLSWADDHWVLQNTAARPNIGVR